MTLVTLRTWRTLLREKNVKNLLWIRSFNNCLQKDHQRPSCRRDHVRQEVREVRLDRVRRGSRVHREVR